MTDSMRLGILTSGGDCAGLNAVIKGAAQMALALDLHIFAIPKGYAGLYNLVHRNALMEIDGKKIESIVSHLAGSASGNSRVKIAKIENPDKYEQIKSGLDKFDIDGLIISGGDDTGSVVVDLADHGVRCVHAPKTMDLDLQTYSVGGDSAVNRIANYIEEVKTTGRSHNRIMIVEVFGRYSGHTAFLGGIAADADCILIPEVPVDFDVVYEHMKQKYFQRIQTSEWQQGTYVIVVAEGLQDATGELMSDDAVEVDAFGHKKLKGSGKYVRNRLSERVDQDGDFEQFLQQQHLFVKGMNDKPKIRETVPGYLIRSGFSTAMDVKFGKEIGAGAVQLLTSGMSGITVTGVTGGEVQYMPTDQVIKQRLVDARDIAFYEKLGVCFGREPETMNLAYIEVKQGAIFY